jgi:type IV pilus assembly protein PilB
VEGHAIDTRIVTMPRVDGEGLVMRILDKTQALIGLEQLGMSEGSEELFEEAFRRSYGAVLVTGPTGSGKSTTLYAALNEINEPQRNIITIEDPVEYQLPGVNQLQVNLKAGLTFAGGLRAMLRADPDVIMVGEIRDGETAKIAIESALTGHLVLSTLHTNDAPSAVTRLIEMGIEPFLVGSALDVVLAQRLLRSLCDRCRQPYTPTGQELLDVGYPWTEGEPLPTLYRAGGCNRCANTGYRGRMALHEVMALNEDIERLAVARASTDDISRVARSQGMSTLREDGWLKVAQGKTSVEEVLRVVV